MEWLETAGWTEKQGIMMALIFREKRHRGASTRSFKEVFPDFKLHNISVQQSSIPIFNLVNSAQKQITSLNIYIYQIYVDLFIYFIWISLCLTAHIARKRTLGLLINPVGLVKDKWSNLVAFSCFYKLVAALGQVIQCTLCLSLAWNYYLELQVDF